MITICWFSTLRVMVRRTAGDRVSGMQAGAGVRSTSGSGAGHVTATIDHIAGQSGLESARMGGWWASWLVWQC